MNPWKGLNNLPRELWIISIAALINRSGSMVLPFMAIYLNKHLHFSVTDAGLVLTAYGVAALITAPVVGKMCDLVSPLKIMKMSLLTSGLLLFLFPFLTEYYQIISLTFFWSILNEAFRPPNLALISDFSSTEQRRIAFALNRLAINLGMSIGPAIGGFLSVINFSLLFYVDGTAHLLSWLFLITYKFKIADSSRRRLEETAVVIKEKVLSHNRKFFLFLLAFIPVLLVFFQMFSTMPLYLIKDLNFSETSYGLLFTVNTIIIIVIEVPLLNYLSHIPNKTLIPIGCFLTAVGFGSMLFAMNIYLIVGTVVIWTFGEMIIFPASAAYVSEIAPENKRGQFLGFYQTANNVAFTLGPWLGTVVYGNFGSAALWGGTFVFGMISAVGIRLLTNKK